MPHPTIALADLRQPQALNDAAPLFDAYRQFYGRSSDLPAARAFLAERAQRGESVVFLARSGSGEAHGFMQLYPSFSSVSLAPTLVLNDLYVAAPVRRSGVGRLLLAAAAAHGRQAGAIRLSLSTQLGNASAQALYESTGWQRDAAFHHYTLSLGAT